MASVHTLGRSERLKSRKQIELLFSKGSRFQVQSIRIFHRRHSDLGGVLQAGFSVSSRNFKKAVDRNRIKRQLREAWRLQKLTLKNFVGERGFSLDVFIIYTGKEMPESGDIRNHVSTSLNKLETAYADGK